MDILPAQTDTQSVALPQSFRLTPTGLDISGNPSFEDWLACGQFLHKYNESIHFCIGDWLNYGELHWGETYRQAVLAFGFNVQTLRNDKWVAGRIPPERRKPELSFSHHEVVASLQPERQEEMLAAAATQGIPSKAFKKFVDDQVYMPAPEPAPKSISSPAQPAVPQQGADNHRIVTDLLDHAFQLMCAIDDCDFRSQTYADKESDKPTP